MKTEQKRSRELENPAQQSSNANIANETNKMDGIVEGLKIKKKTNKEKPKNRENVTHRTQQLTVFPHRPRKSGKAGLHTLNRKSQKQNSASLSSCFPAFLLLVLLLAWLPAFFLVFPRFSAPLLWLFHCHCEIVGAASGSLLKRRGPKNVLGASKNVIGNASAKKPFLFRSETMEEIIERIRQWQEYIYLV